MPSDCYLIHTPELDHGGFPPTCRFNTGRAGRAREMIDSLGLLDGPEVREQPPVTASRTDLLRAHSAAYLDALARAGRGQLDDAGRAMGLDGQDTPVFPDLDSFFGLAAGGTLTAARLLLSGDARLAFNPSGGFHHACRERAEGFCFINDVVMAADLLAEAGRRVLILDVDAHHCNGVQEAFYERDDVFVISLHQDGRTIYPGTGAVAEIGLGRGRGYTVNIPLQPGTDDAVYLEAYRQIVEPLIHAYAADVVIVELGMDAIAGDPLADLALSNNVYVEVLESLLALDRPLLATGGGGYHLDNTVRAWALCWSVLCGHHAQDDFLGMGGVMLGSRDYVGGLRDRVLPTPPQRSTRLRRVMTEVHDALRATVFPLHDLID